MPLRRFFCVIAAAAVALPAAAAPFVPSTDSEVLEQLPYSAGDAAFRQLRLLSNGLKKQPDNLPLALRIARGYEEMGRASGDPRYSGYAQAALAPWWGLTNPPPEVLTLRATLNQRVHLFDAALKDLGAVLDADPRDAQALLLRATIFQVVGQFDRAKSDCGALDGIAIELVSTACLDNVNAMTGSLHESYEHLRAMLEKFPNAQRGIRSWALTSLAEMAGRAGLLEQAEADFRQALAIDPKDNYLLAAFSDFLLDRNRPAEVEGLLKSLTRNDPLLLRYALALKALGAPETQSFIDQLRDRFEASHLRGDRVHLREEARFRLQLLGDSGAALRLARDNWQVQKEVADIRILLESAIAAHEQGEFQSARAWLAETGLEDENLRALAARTFSAK